MCGITAVYSRSSSLASSVKKEAELISKMAEHQRKRGPDTMKFWGDGQAILGHNRLSINDLSERGNMPMHSLDWVLTYNGEIYNLDKLREMLPDVEGVSEMNDSRLLLAHLQRWGMTATLASIEGMFAFVAYNKFTGVMLAAVDHLSIKPLYYYQNSEFVAFASAPAALSYCEDRWDIDPISVRHYLSLGATRQPLFQGMYKLEPGHMMVVTREGATKHQWYSVKKWGVTPAQVLDKVRNSIQSVSKADVPICMFLSGGVDSTIVASELPGMPAVHLKSPELRYARQVADKFNNPLQVIDPEEFYAEECLQDYSRQSGDCSAAAIIPYMVSKEVAKNHKVAISSNGADELFFGYARTGQDFVTESQVAHIFRKKLYFEPDTILGSRDFELNTYVAYDLNKTLDFASMCHSLEVRVPYLNRTVIDYALSLPRAAHVSGAIHKKILKDHLASLGFDHGFIHRQKLGFSLFSEPVGYEQLKEDGVRFVADRFGIKPDFRPGTRDERYFAAAAAALLVWCRAWESKLTF